MFNHNPVCFSKSTIVHHPDIQVGAIPTLKIIELTLVHFLIIGCLLNETNINVSTID